MPWTTGGRPRRSASGTNLSDRDLDGPPTGVHINVDLLSQLDRYGRRAPGSTVGIRVNPRAGRPRPGLAGLYTGGHRPSKFGILQEQLDDALEDRADARPHDRHGSPSRRPGCAHRRPTGVRDGRRARRPDGRAARRGRHPISEVNVGGGLGVPYDTGQEPLDVHAYADVLRRHLAPSASRSAASRGLPHERHGSVARRGGERRRPRRLPVRRCRRRVQRRARALHLRGTCPDRPVPSRRRTARASGYGGRQHQRGRRPVG